jgi:hypothetical protein
MYLTAKRKLRGLTTKVTKEHKDRQVVVVIMPGFHARQDNLAIPKLKAADFDKRFHAVLRDLRTDVQKTSAAEEKSLCVPS